MVGSKKGAGPRPGKAGRGGPGYTGLVQVQGGQGGVGAMKPARLVSWPERSGMEAGSCCRAHLSGGLGLLSAA